MKDLITKLTNGANMKRWNDELCPVELTELDKQAHKMIIAFILSKFEEESNNKKGKPHNVPISLNIILLRTKAIVGPAKSINRQNAD